MRKTGRISAAAWRQVANAVREAIQIAASFASEESQLRLLIQQMPVSIALFDSGMRYLAVSEGWREDYGLGDANLIGHSHYEIFPDIPQRWKALHQRGLAGEILRETHDRFQRSDGRTHVLRWEMWPWQTAGRVAGIFITSEPVGTRYEPREVECEIAQSLARTGIWRLHRNCQRVTMSAEMQRIFGRPAEKMLSYKDFIEAVHPSDRERVERSWQGALEGRPYDIEYRISAGEIDRVVRAQARLQFSAEGKPLGGVGIVQDITGERNAELVTATRLATPSGEALFRLEQLLESMNRMENSLATLRNAAIASIIADDLPSSQFKQAAQLLGAKAAAFARDAVVLSSSIDKAERRRRRKSLN